MSDDEEQAVIDAAKKLHAAVSRCSDTHDIEKYVEKSEAVSAALAEVVKAAGVLLSREAEHPAHEGSQSDAARDLARDIDKDHSLPRKNDPDE